MKRKQFDIWLADRNPRFGTEPGKTRPVIVIQTDLLNLHHPSTIICPITTNVQPGAEILRVHLKKGTAKLKTDCDIMIDQVRAIDNKRLIRKIGTIDPEMRQMVRTNLSVLFDL